VIVAVEALAAAGVAGGGDASRGSSAIAARASEGGRSGWGDLRRKGGDGERNDGRAARVKLILLAFFSCDWANSGLGVEDRISDRWGQHTDPLFSL
jgi:hypothetical protein